MIAAILTRGRSAVLLGSLTLGIAAGVGYANAAERVIFAVDPIQTETNIFWEGVGDRVPGAQALIGHDPMTGEYTNNELAEFWEQSEGYTVWTVTLHPDAEFHFDWGPVTAEDVLFSYEMSTSETSTAVGRERIAGAIVAAIDERTIEFRYPDARFDWQFYNAGRGALTIYSKAQFDAEGIEGLRERPALTGPYQFMERRPGESLVVERVENHWQNRDADFAEIEMRYVAEPATKLALILSGEAHASDLPSELHADALATGMEIVESNAPAMHTGAIFNGMYMTTGDPNANPDLPWADVRIREAMNRAIDREALLDILYAGGGTLIPKWGMDPRHEGFASELFDRFEEMYGYDPDRARELLQEAGYPDAFSDPTIPLVSSVLAGNPEFGAMTELLDVFFTEIGLQTRIVEMDWPSLGAMGRAREAFVVNPIRNAPVRPTQPFINTFYTIDGTIFGGWEDDVIEEVAQQLNTETDPELRDEIARQGFVHLFDTYAEIPMVAVNSRIVINPDVVANWEFPGISSSTLSHWHLIEAAE